MSFRISPLWWPFLAAASPVLTPVLLSKNRRFERNREAAERLNRSRIAEAEPIDLPELEFLDLTVLVEEKTEEGFLGDAGVSYLFRTDRGALLFDVGFGPERPALGWNAARLGISLSGIDALAISHLHLDHMGGLAAVRTGRVRIPAELGGPDGQPCYLPAPAAADGFACEIVDRPRMLSAGIASTGPLARSLFFMGLTEEQVLVARIRGKGLAVFTGCGHPGIEPILDMVRRISGERIHAIGGGLHLPITAGRGNRAGIQLQRVLGTGLPPWRRISDGDLGTAIAGLNRTGARRIFLSAHDSCDHTLARMQRELGAETLVLKAGSTCRI